MALAAAPSLESNMYDAETMLKKARPSGASNSAILAMEMQYSRSCISVQNEKILSKRAGKPEPV